MCSSMSIVEYFSENSGSSCGYCKGKSSSFSHGLWGHILTPSDYQDMIDRGWRRSGKYCYKPIMDKTCCPQYPIRCNVKEFVPRKSHKKVMKRFRSFIINDAGANRKKILDQLPPLPANKLKVSSDDSEDEESFSSEDEANNAQTKLDSQKADEVESKLELSPSQNADSVTSSTCIVKMTDRDNPIDQKQDTAASEVRSSSQMAHDTNDGISNKGNIKPGLGPDPNKPRARKAKDIRKERAMLKNQPKGNLNNMSLAESAKKLPDQKIKPLIDQLTDLNSFPKDSKHKLEIRLVHAQTTDCKFMESFEESFEVYRKYQVTIHKDKPEKCTANQFTRFLCNSSIVQGGSTSGLNLSSDESEFLPSGFGAYHQQYLIDGKVVCVGVLDILPHCTSSVYFYYDPEYSFLSLGTLSSLFEISYVRKLATLWRPELFYYYMGFYIHSCPKMRYKSQYDPSYLLCPETYEWVNVDQCEPKLDNSKYSRFYQDMNTKAVYSQPPSDDDLDSVLVLHKHEAMPYGMLTELKKRKWPYDNDGDTDEVREYSTLIGISLAKKMLLYRK